MQKLFLTFLVAILLVPQVTFAAQVATITIDSTKVAADLTDFIVYIDLSNLPSSFWNVTNCTDIRVYKSDGITELAREIVSCVDNGSTGTGELHVKYSGTLSGSVDTDIQIHADGSSSDYAVTDTYGRNAVWSDYAWVSHMKDLSTSSIEDSTSGGRTGTKSSANNPLEATAKIGTGQDVDGTDLIDTASVPMTATDNFTLQAWLNPDAATTNTAIIHNGANSDGYAIAMRNDGTKVGWTMLIAAITWGESATLPAVTAATWQMVHATRSAGTTYLFKNAVKSTGVTNTPNTPTARLRLGVATFDTAYAGLIDEVRLRNSVLSDSWITTEYNNQNSPSTFYSVTAVEVATTEDILWFFF